ncbi:MAG: universal stress protein [Symploca sp. SIO1B1]|nr:universal stress protein [Symploca sp. SIO1C2]NER96299.1 universal stress protein [Symploca sp. SIO1B1]
MYKKILVPLDGSQRAEAILPHVENLAKHDEANVVFTQVIEPATRSAILNLEQDSEVAFKTQKIDTTQKYLTGWKDQFQEQGLSAEILLLRGVAVEAILYAVEATKTQLVAMTSQGRTGLAQVFYGSVASGVLNRVNCPILLVRPETKPSTETNKRILVPLDGSIRSETVIPHVEGIATLYNAKITLVRIVRTGYQTTVFADLEQDIKEELVSEKLFNKLGQHQEIERVKEARQYLLNWQKQLQDQGLDVEVALMYGRPIDSIIKIAEEINADLIAMTSKGRTGLEQVFYGSVASGILNRSTRPLLLVPARKAVDEAPVNNFV